MSKLSKRAIPILILLTVALSMIPLIPVHAISFTSVTNDDDPLAVDEGVYDDLIIVLGSGVTAG
jgi:hypothetical protein